MNKEIFTARYDPKTDRIEGCTPYTRVWHHEDRHRQQFKNEKVQGWNYVCDISDYVGKAICVSSLSLYWFQPMLSVFLFIIAGIFMLPGFIFTGIIELDAVLYARNK